MYIPDVGELMSASFPSNPKIIQQGSWYVSLKSHSLPLLPSHPSHPTLSSPLLSDYISSVQVWVSRVNMGQQGSGTGNKSTRVNRSQQESTRVYNGQQWSTMVNNGQQWSTMVNRSQQGLMNEEVRHNEFRQAIHLPVSVSQC